MRNPQIIWATGHGPEKLGPQDTGSRAWAESAEGGAGQGHQRQRETRFPRALPTRHRAGASAMPIGGGTPTRVRGLQASRAEGEGRKQLSRPGPKTGPGAEPEPASSVCLVLSHSCTDGDPHP